MRALIYLALVCIFSVNYLPAQSIQRISSEQADILLPTLNDTLSVIIDGRTAEMYAEGHISGAVNINAFSEDAKQQLNAYLNKDVLIIYCTRQKRAKKLIELLSTANYKGSIYIIEDGITGWKESGFPIIHN